MRNHRQEVLRLDGVQGMVFEKALDVFKKWTADILAESDFYHDPYNPVADDDNDSARTNEGRMDTAAYPRFRHQTPATHSHTSTQSRKCIRGKEDSDVAWLDGKTLRALDEDASPRKRLIQKTDYFCLGY